mgnify:CR=1 FL=1
MTRVLHEHPLPFEQVAVAADYVIEVLSRKVVTYWMNRLQSLPDPVPLFVTLNPSRQPAQGSIHRSFLYDHPMFDRAAIRAQRLLWNLQGARRTWFCGAHFGHGFHEDGLQAGLAMAQSQNCGLGEIWVATGVYTPGATISDTFQLVSGVALYGGFETAVELGPGTVLRGLARDIDRSITVHSISSPADLDAVTQELARVDAALVFFEAPHRILKAVDDLAQETFLLAMISTREMLSITWYPLESLNQPS